MPDLDRMWAPWRIGFILGPRADGCFLCEAPRLPEEKDPETCIVERGRSCFAILNRYPYNNGHLLISPYRHLGELTDLAAEELNEMMRMSRDWVDILRDVMKPEGFNLGMNLGKVAGAGVADHVHMHVVPRWGGDTNFMSVVGDLRVVNQSLEQCHALLVEACAKRVASEPRG